MHENDPDRLNPRPLGDPADARVSPRLALSALVILAIIALTFAFWPAMNTATQVTDNQPVYRAPADTPAPPTRPQ
jgi:hypothetical protein